MQSDHGCMKRSEVDISLKHDAMATFLLNKWTWIPKSGANLAVVTEWGCTYMALRQHTNGSKTLYISNVYVLGSGLRWILASNMMLWHHVHSTSESEFRNLGPIWPVEWYQGAPIWPWDSMPMAKTSCIRLIWMYYKVQWGGPRWISASTIMLWHHFHSTRSESEFPNPGPTWQAGRMKIRVHPYALETQHTNELNTLDVSIGCMKRSEVDISLKHDTMATFSLHKWIWIPKSGANLTSVTV